MDIKLPQLPQSQESLEDQLIELCIIGNKMGLYDAVDWLKNNCNIILG